MALVELKSNNGGHLYVDKFCQIKALYEHLILFDECFQKGL